MKQTRKTKPIRKPKPTKKQVREKALRAFLLECARIHRIYYLHGERYSADYLVGNAYRDYRRAAGLREPKR